MNVAANIAALQMLSRYTSFQCESKYTQFSANIATTTIRRKFFSTDVRCAIRKRGARVMSTAAA